MFACVCVCLDGGGTPQPYLSHSDIVDCPMIFFFGVRHQSSQKTKSKKAVKTE